MWLYNKIQMMYLDQKTMIIFWMIFVIAIIVSFWCYNKYLKWQQKQRLKNGIKIDYVKRKVKETKPIYSLETGRSISGSFVLGCGTIDDELKYYFYVDKECGKQISSVDADSVILVETNNSPKIEYLDYDYDFEYTIDNSDKIDTSVEAILYVPKKTIKMKFNANLK